MPNAPSAGFDYPGLVTTALKGVLREVLRRVADSGFPGEHHLFISFRTDAPGVTLAARLRASHPREMTIVLQHQFWGLAADDDGFSVQLRFGGALERLTVPWDAVVAFADPSVPFGLRFAPADEDPAPAEVGAPPAEDAETPRDTPAVKGAAKVVAFRPAGRTKPRRRGPPRA
jgi:hypothetical protein